MIKSLSLSMARSLAALAAMSSIAIYLVPTASLATASTSADTRFGHDVVALPPLDPVPGPPNPFCRSPFC